MHNTVRVEKSGAIQSKQKLESDFSQRKPMEFITRLEELQKTKVKKHNYTYTPTEKTSKRK